MHQYFLQMMQEQNDNGSKFNELIWGWLKTGCRYAEIYQLQTHWCQVKPVKYCMVPSCKTQHMCYACLFTHCTTPVLTSSQSSIFILLYGSYGVFCLVVSCWVWFLTIDECSGKQRRPATILSSLKLTCNVAVKHIFLTVLEMILQC